MEHKKTKKITAQYPLDIFGATFYYDISDDNIMHVFHPSWENIGGMGKTIQKAVRNTLKNSMEQLELIRESEANNDKILGYNKSSFNMMEWLEKVEEFRNENE